MSKILSEQEFKSRLQKCQLLALDFDGVLTDNSVYVDSDGREMVRCDRYDSVGLQNLKNLKMVEIAILTQEPADIGLVPKRAKKLNIDCYCGLGPRKKLPALIELIRKLNIPGLENVCYVGNDLNDLECLQNVGLAIAVADAHPDILGSVNWIASRPGGHGAVREICDLMVTAKK